MPADFLNWLSTIGGQTAGMGVDPAQEGGGALASLGDVAETGRAPMPSTGTADPTGPAPSSQMLSTPHSSGGDSMGSQFLKMLPLLAAGGAAAFAAHKSGGLSGGDAIAHMTNGFLQDKLSNALTKKKNQNEMDEFLVKQAYNKVDALNGKNLSGIKVPENLKNRLIELHQKANEARMNDGVVTPKEAQEILALAGPIEAELEQAKTAQNEPEAQAVDKEKAMQAMLGQRDSATGAEPGSAYKAYADASTQISVPGHPELGMMSKKDAAGIIAKDAAQKVAERKVDASIQNTIASNARIRARFQAGLNGADSRAFNSALAAQKAKILSMATQTASAAGIVPGSPAFDSIIEDATKQVLGVEEKLGGPAMQGKPPGSQPSRPTARRVVRGPDGTLTLQ